MSDPDHVSMAGTSAHENLDSLHQGCQVIGFDLTCLYVNESLVAQVRTSREQLLGRTMMDCYPGIGTTNILPAVRRTVEPSVSSKPHSICSCVRSDRHRGTAV